MILKKNYLNLLEVLESEKEGYYPNNIINLFAWTDMDYSQE